MITMEPADKRGCARVTFELSTAVWANRVNLVGAFNGWDTTATPMSRRGLRGTWSVTVELETGRRYAFRYLVDGVEWRNDWHADDYEDSTYGSLNSVVDLTIGSSCRCRTQLGPGRERAKTPEKVGDRDA